MVGIQFPCPHCGLPIDMVTKQPFLIMYAVMKLLQVSRSTIYNWQAKSNFPKSVNGILSAKKCLLDRKEVLKWLKKHHSPEAAAKMDQVLP